MKGIFKWFTLADAPETEGYVHWFCLNFKPEDFNEIDRLMMCFLTYCSFLSVVPTREHLEAYLRVDAKTDIKKYSIRLETMSVYDYKETSQLEEAFSILKDTAISTFDDYCSVDLTNRQFKVDMYEFMSLAKADAIQDVFMRSYPKLSDGTNVNEVSDYVKGALAKVDETYDLNKIKEIDYSRDSSEKSTMNFVAKTGFPCIDGDIGGIYTRLIYTLNAQPAGGKTRFSLVHFVYPTLVEAKKDVIYYETELSQSQVENILIAYHITRVYNGRVKIPDSLMNKADGMTKEQQQIYESARIDLFESGRYGKFIFKNGVVVEKFRDEVMNLLKVYKNTKLLCIDYMGLCKSKPLSKYDRPKQQYEIITDAYEIVRDILLTVDVAAVCINQYNDDGIKAAEQGKPIRSGHVQGGHIVQRHTDYDISMTFTEEQWLAKVRSFSTSKTRGTEGFRNTLASVDLSVSIFRQMANVNEV